MFIAKLQIHIMIISNESKCSLACTLGNEIQKLQEFRKVNIEHIISTIQSGIFCFILESADGTDRETSLHASSKGKHGQKKRVRRHNLCYPE